MSKTTAPASQKETFKLAEQIHRQLARYAKRRKSEDESTCALRIAVALWVCSAKVPENVARALARPLVR
jgi:hypothetical protein